MRYSVEVSSAPPAEPLTLTETKLHLKVDISDDDDLIDGLIQSAREWVENYCRRSLVQQTLKVRLDDWNDGEIRLPGAPVQSVSSVEYLADSGSNLLTLDSGQYQVDTYSVPPRIVPAASVVWPVLATGKINRVVVTYVAGYTPGSSSPTDYAENVPGAVKSAMKLLIAHWYDNRSAVAAGNVPPSEVPLAVKALLGPYEVRDYTLE